MKVYTAIVGDLIPSSDPAVFKVFTPDRTDFESVAEWAEWQRCVAIRRS